MRGIGFAGGLAVIVAVATGCPTVDPSAGDVDGDGFTTEEGDCNDQDSSVYPDAEEVCDGKDNDCNGIVDDPFDVDQDGWSSCNGDCDDDDPDIYPNAEEICDGIDNDCDDEIDEGLDDDHDGWCEEEGDCDDDDPTTYPGAAEQCDGKDNDCNGTIDDGFDEDGDGYSPCGEENADCADDDPDIYPGAPEECNGMDDDCDTLIDEDFDEDGDGWAYCSGDCDDTDPDVHPGAPEQCNGYDDDCDGVIDEEVDEDGDGLTPCDGDCNDLDASIYPGALDGPDGLDDDCDGDVDEFYGWDLSSEELQITVQGAMNARLGYALAGGGDVTGNGLPDLFAGAPFDDGISPNTGNAEVVEGEAADWWNNPPVLGVAHFIDGTVTDAQVGAAVAVGDLDGDGAADLALGGPYREFSMIPDGEVYLFFGGAGAIASNPDVGDADRTIRGDFAGEHAGYALATGDVDGDGTDDLLVGAPYNNQNGGLRGAAYLFLGSASWAGINDTADADAVFYGIEDDGLMGGAVAIAPSLDGDPYDDIVIGCHLCDGTDGEVYVIDGHGGAWSDQDVGAADATFYANGGEHWGAAVGGIPDLTGDGRGELWIGSYDRSPGGGVAVFFGIQGGFAGNTNLAGADTLFAGASGDQAGVLAAPGDMTGDGVPEIAIGARGNAVAGAEAGAVYLIDEAAGSWGATYDLSTAPARVLGEAQGDWFGHALAPVGDFNDDGLPDLAVGAPYNDQVGSGSGKVYLLFGY